MPNWRSEIHTHGDHQRAMTRPHPEPETPRCQLRHHLRLLHHDQRMPGKGRHNRGAQLNALRTDCSRRKHRNAIETSPARGHPRRINTEFFRPLDHVENIIHMVATCRNANPLLAHRLPFRCITLCFTRIAPARPDFSPSHPELHQYDPEKRLAAVRPRASPRHRDIASSHPGSPVAFFHPALPQ